MSYRCCLVSAETRARYSSLYAMSGTEGGSPSGRSTRSRSSGHSVRDVIDPAASKPKGNKGKTKLKQRATPRTSWTSQETEEFLKLLLYHLPSAGDSNFKEETFNQVAEELNRKFTEQKVPKTNKSCHLKWSNVSVIFLRSCCTCTSILTIILWKIKNEFYLVHDIRSASGFHYSDTEGLSVDSSFQAAWEGFCKVSMQPGPPHLFTDPLLVTDPH
jgi:hypothetical protein